MWDGWQVKYKRKIMSEGGYGYSDTFAHDIFPPYQGMAVLRIYV